MSSTMSDCPAGYVKQNFDLGEIAFALKGYHPTKNRYAKCWTPQHIKQEVLESPRLNTLIAQLASDEGVEVEVYQKRVGEMLEEIGHKMNILSVKTVALLVRGPIRNVLRGIYIEEKGLEELRSTVTQWPVILLPSHRSYLDFILVTYFMLEFNIQLPTIAAGQDFMGMKFMSYLLRRSGAFFLRRTFGSDRLYKLVFSLYTQAILCSGDAPVEFFIEGTRSRAAKSLHPKLGLLSMIVEPYLNGSLPDIMLFPMSISYEKTFEEILFARELLGVPKPKESTTGLMKARSLLSSDYGRIFVNFSSPISLHDVCLKWGISRVPHGLYPRTEFFVTAKEKEMVTKLGYLIIERINQGLKVFPSAILSAILLQNSKGISKDDLVKQSMWLRRQVELRGAQVEWKLTDDAASVVEYSLSLLSFETSSIATAPSTSSADSIPPWRREEIMNESFPYLKLAHYRNQLLHWFVLESIFLLCFGNRKELPASEVKRLFLTLIKALAKEFVLPQIPAEQLFVDTCQVLLDRRLVDRKLDQDVVVLSLRTDQCKAISFIANLIQPFVAGVWVMCQYLHSLRGGVQTMKSTFKNAQTLAMGFINKGVLNTYEPLSLDMLKNVVASLNSAGLLLQLEMEFEGHDRLVKVAHQDEFELLIKDIEFVLFPDNSKLQIFRVSKL